MLFSWLRFRRGLKAACLGAALATAWSGTPAQAAPYRVSGYVEPVTPLTHVHVAAMYYESGTSDTYWAVHELAGPVPGGRQTGFSFIIEDRPGWVDIHIVDRYYVLAIDDDVNDGVTVNMPSATAAAAISASLTWDQHFTPTQPWLPTESELADALRSTAGTGMTGFCEYYGRYYSKIGELFGQQSTLVSFSAAADNGIAYAEVVEIPEPGTVILVIVGAAFVTGYRRRRAES